MLRYLCFRVIKSPRDVGGQQAVGGTVVLSFTQPAMRQRWDGNEVTSLSASPNCVHHSRQCRLQPLDAGRVLGTGVGGLDGQRLVLGDPLVPHGVAVLGREPRQSVPPSDHARRQVHGVEPVHELNAGQGQPGEKRNGNILRCVNSWVRNCVIKALGCIILFPRMSLPLGRVHATKCPHFF